jgi:hypothetical protein
LFDKLHIKTEENKVPDDSFLPIGSYYKKVPLYPESMTDNKDTVLDMLKSITYYSESEERITGREKANITSIYKEILSDPFLSPVLTTVAVAGQIEKNKPEIHFIRDCEQHRGVFTKKNIIKIAIPDSPRGGEKIIHEATHAAAYYAFSDKCYENKYYYPFDIMTNKNGKIPHWEEFTSCLRIDNKNIKPKTTLDFYITAYIGAANQQFYWNNNQQYIERVTYMFEAAYSFGLAAVKRKFPHESRFYENVFLTRCREYTKGMNINLDKHNISKTNPSNSFSINSISRIQAVAIIYHAFYEKWGRTDFTYSSQQLFNVMDELSDTIRNILKKNNFKRNDIFQPSERLTKRGADIISENLYKDNEKYCFDARNIDYEAIKSIAEQEAGGMRKAHSSIIMN